MKDAAIEFEMQKDLHLASSPHALDCGLNPAPSAVTETMRRMMMSRKAMKMFSNPVSREANKRTEISGICLAISGWVTSGWWILQPYHLPPRLYSIILSG